MSKKDLIFGKSSVNLLEPDDYVSGVDEIDGLGALVYADGYLVCRKGCGSKFKKTAPLDRHETVCTPDPYVDPLEVSNSKPTGLMFKPLAKLTGRPRGRPRKKSVIVPFHMLTYPEQKKVIGPRTPAKGRKSRTIKPRGVGGQIGDRVVAKIAHKGQTSSNVFEKPETSDE